MNAIEIYSNAALVVNNTTLTSLTTLDIGKLSTRMPDRIALFLCAASITGAPTSLDVWPSFVVNSLEHSCVELAAYSAAAAITTNGHLQITPALSNAYTPLFHPGGNSLRIIYQGSGCNGSNYFVCALRAFAYYHVR